MPELPEVEVTLRAIAPALIGKKITAVIIREHRLRWPIPTDLAQLLCGHTIQAIERRGKYLLLQVGDGSLILHLGMSGRLALLPQNTPAHKHDHIDIAFAPNQLLRFRDPRRFGAVLWATTAASHPLIQNLGVEPLSAEFSGDYLYQQTRQRQTPIKSFIMNAKYVVGVGNIYANEALFLAKINPHRQAKQLTRAESVRLVECIQTVLQQAIIKGGSSLRDFQNADGRTGYFQQTLNVYGRAGEACVYCARKLIDSRLGKRQTVYCAHCQK